MSRFALFASHVRQAACFGTALALLALAGPASAQNLPPLAFAAGPYTGTVGLPVSFNGHGSSDLDGDPLSFEWDFGDGTSAVGPTPSHTYGAPGTYTATLTVSDGELSDSDQALVTIVGMLGARAFLQGGNETIKLGGGKPSLCVRIEPMGGSFQVTDVLLSSIRLRSAGTGLVEEIGVQLLDVAVDGDRDRNGVVEIRACFSKDDLRRLFSNVSGRASVPVQVRGHTRAGNWFAGDFVMTVEGSGGSLQTSLRNDPAQGTAFLQLEAVVTGSLRVRLYDVNGRDLGTLSHDAGPGSRPLFDLASAVRGHGKPRSGVYFYRVESLQGTAGGRFVLIR